MNIVNIVGGLGNQMFQYAFFLSLLKKGEDVKIDISNFTDYYSHNGLEIEKVFNLSLSDSICLTNIYKDFHYFFRLRKFLGLMLGDVNKFINKNHYLQSNYSEYINNVYEKENTFFDGYWQNEKYIESVENDLRTTFVWNLKLLPENNNEIYNLINESESISLHIRKKDKIRNFKDVPFWFRNNIVYCNIPISYYKKSVNFIKSNVKDPCFFIFSNDPEWISRNLDLFDLNKKNSVIVNVNKGEMSNWDMFLMSKCKHNIISSSTFSWWSAWLNSNKNKIVVAPSKWNVRIKKDMGIIPNVWHRI